MQDTVQDGRSNGNIGKDHVPLGEDLHKDNELEEQVCDLNIQGKITGLIHLNYQN